MTVVYDWADVAPCAPHIQRLCLGFFDGLHLGHQQVILGKKEDRKITAVFTFQNHPTTVLNPSQRPLLLTGLPHKLQLLADYSIGYVIALPFTESQAHQTAEDFLENLKRCLPHLSTISVGYNWKFGYQRRGHVDMLQHWAEKQKISIQVSLPVTWKDIPISSSRIRQAIQAGHLSDVSAMLGRTFGLYGKVIQGQQKGHAIGFPTINLETEDECLPSNGVYAGLTRLQDGSLWKSAINIGLRPTIPGTIKPQVEAHLLDFSGNLYGQSISIYLMEYLRPEQKFTSIEDLKRAIALDVEKIRQKVPEDS